jgi:hypothetical protein
MRRIRALGRAKSGYALMFCGGQRATGICCYDPARYLRLSFTGPVMP